MYLVNLKNSQNDQFSQKLIMIQNYGKGSISKWFRVLKLISFIKT